jgi:hypothetical protein
MPKAFVNKYILGLALPLLAIINASATNTTLNPGQDKPGDPGNLTVGGGSTVIASTGPKAFCASDGTGGCPGTGFTSEIMGTYSVTVYSDPSNVYCSGCYDFVITLTSSGSTDAIQHVTEGSFNSTQVTVGWEAPPGGTACGPNPVTPPYPTNCYDTPNEVSRTTTGKTVAFNFNGVNNILDMQSSAWLIIETSTMSYNPGTTVIADDVSNTFTGYGDLPEPMTMGLLGVGFSLIGVARWRHLRKQPKS